MSTAELIEAMAKALHVKPRLLPLPTTLIKLLGTLLGKRQAVQRVLGSLTIDSKPLQHDLNWQPPYSMEQGLQATAQWVHSPALKP